ncbi:MAG: hypothetical protein WBB49_00800, partial [Microgenomates group bacterium]
VALIVHAPWVSVEEKLGVGFIATVLAVAVVTVVAVAVVTVVAGVMVVVAGVTVVSGVAVVGSVGVPAVVQRTLASCRLPGCFTFHCSTCVTQTGSRLDTAEVPLFTVIALNASIPKTSVITTLSAV